MRDRREWTNLQRETKTYPKQDFYKLISKGELVESANDSCKIEYVLIMHFISRGEKNSYAKQYRYSEIIPTDTHFYWSIDHRNGTWEKAVGIKM